MTSRCIGLDAFMGMLTCSKFSPCCRDEGPIKLLFPRGYPSVLTSTSVPVPCRTWTVVKHRNRQLGFALLFLQCLRRYQHFDVIVLILGQLFKTFRNNIIDTDFASHHLFDTFELAWGYRKLLSPKRERIAYQPQMPVQSRRNLYRHTQTSTAP